MKAMQFSGVWRWEGGGGGGASAARPQIAFFLNIIIRRTEACLVKSKHLWMNEDVINS